MYWLAVNFYLFFYNFCSLRLLVNVDASFIVPILISSISTIMSFGRKKRRKKKQKKEHCFDERHRNMKHPKIGNIEHINHSYCNTQSSAFGMFHLVKFKTC